ncbi:DUF983 domain-containing protein [Terricaulis sp.]|uniref:DUF983 domain-containing protein n=1 Tax=Terricaulis sp. TaxID=2768686 RepID=UPI0037852220
MAQAERSLLRAVQRGVRGRCPACGRGRSLDGYIAPAPRCTTCDEDLAPYQTADFAPYLVVFLVGLIFTPLVFAIARWGAAPDWLLFPLLAAAVALAIVLLPRAKGVAIGLLWALDVRS